MFHANASHETFTFRNDVLAWHHQSLPIRATFHWARRDEDGSKRIFRDVFGSIASRCPLRIVNAFFMIRVNPLHPEVNY